MPKKDYLEGAVNHFKHQETRIIEVPEWGLVGDDAIYVKPFTLLEKDSIFKPVSIKAFITSLIG